MGLLDTRGSASGLCKPFKKGLTLNFCPTRCETPAPPPLDCGSAGPQSSVLTGTPGKSGE